MFLFHCVFSEFGVKVAIVIRVRLPRSSHHTNLAVKSFKVSKFTVINAQKLEKPTLDI